MNGEGNIFVAFDFSLIFILKYWWWIEFQDLCPESSPWEPLSLKSPKPKTKLPPEDNTSNSAKKDSSISDNYLSEKSPKLSNPPEPPPSVNSATASESPPNTGPATKLPSPSTSKSVADNKLCKTAQSPNSLLTELSEVPKPTQNNKSKNGSTNSVESLTLKLEDKSASSLYSLTETNWAKQSASCLKLSWDPPSSQSRSKLWNQPSIKTLPTWTHTRTLSKWFTTPPSETIIWVSPAPVSEKTPTPSLLIKSNNSTTNSTSEKTSLFQVLEKLTQLNSTIWSTNISVVSDHLLRVKSPTKNNHS